MSEPEEVQSVVSETEEQQKENDARLIPNPGDSRVMYQAGKVKYKTGEVMETVLKFVRTRNKEGGVDVRMFAPTMAMGAATQKL